MNIVAKQESSGRWLILKVREDFNGMYTSSGVLVNPNGKVYRHYRRECYPTEVMAEERMKRRMTVKKKFGWRQVQDNNIPDNIWNLAGDEVSNEDMFNFMTDISRERIVVLTAEGVKDYEREFDAGVEYVAVDMGDGFFTVFDNFGESHNLAEFRFDSIEESEDSKKLRKIRGK